MKKSMLMVLSAIILTAMLSIQTAQAQDKTSPWPGVTMKVLTDNDRVNVSEVTFAPGAVATWHSHPQYTVYALTDVKMRVEIKGKETTVAELKAGQSIWSPAVTHQTTNVGKTPFTVIVSEIKEGWPGVTINVLTDNDHVNVSEVTFAPGAVATWHSHPQYTVYALTDVKMQVEIKGKETAIAELKAGQSIWSPAVTHQTTNVGKTPFTVIVSEIKEKPHKH